MPSPGALAPPRLPIEDTYLELLADTLESLDLPARGQFLQSFLRTVAHVEMRESDCVHVWDETLARRRAMTDQSGRQVAFKAALMDVLASSGFLRVPIIIEHEDLKKLELNAVTDPLTGLYNRRLFGESFEKELNRARRYTQPLSLAILDLHRFKEVNDKHGHPRGDEVLRATAATLKKALRTSDSAFRIGGDEFALLLPQTDSQQALALSRRVETVFAEMIRPLQLEVTVSMDHGIAIFPEDAEQADQLIRIADERLYRQKHDNHKKTVNGARRTETPQAEETTSASPARGEERAPTSAAAVATPGPLAPPISIEKKRAPEKAENNLQAQASAVAASLSAQVVPALPRMFAVQRKAERVSMAGTNAYAVLGEQGGKRARVVDLGFGGVAIEFDSQEEVSENLFAVLHVPILPPVRVNLKPVWKQPTAEGGTRVGCSFVS
ncbi:MAG TPA: GGDEF domain-containing protein [Candidatus Acidoferrum sp.]|nr:GGDEF domain-containing protein [Candidatus Acidoferrum sp.]